MKAQAHTKSEAFAKLEAHFKGMQAMAESPYERATLDLSEDLALATVEWLDRWKGRVPYEQLQLAWSDAASGAAAQIVGLLTYRDPKALDNLRLMLTAAFTVDMRRKFAQFTNGDATVFDIEEGKS